MFSNEANTNQWFSVKNTLCICFISGITLAGCSSSGVKKDLGPEKTEQAYYDAAQRELRSGQFDDASRNLKALETFFPVGAYTEQSQLDLMYAYYRQSDYAAAISTAEHFIRFYPNNPQLDYAHYLRGVSNMAMGANAIMHFFGQKSAERDLGQARIAFDNFKTLVTTYPNSKYTPDALLRMQYIRSQLAQNELSVAQFYMKRNAYLAAVARATTIVQFFPSSPQVPEALKILVDGYEKTGNTELVKQYQEVLRLNYPQLLESHGVAEKLKANAEAAKASLSKMAEKFTPVAAAPTLKGK